MGGKVAVLMLGLITTVGCGITIMGGGDDDEGAGRIEVLENVTFDEAWEATIDTFEELRLPIDNLERQSGVITTDWVLLDDAEDYMNCPDDASRNEEGRFNVFLREVGDGIRVTVNASYQAEDDTERRHSCVSTGDYEDLILRRVRSKAT